MGIRLTHAVSVQWLSPQMSGRKHAPNGPIYAATARFVDDPLDKQFSFMLRLSPNSMGNSDRVQEAEFGIVDTVANANFVCRLQPGELLLLHEGRKVVGLCMVGNPGEVKPPEVVSFDLY